MSPFELERLAKEEVFRRLLADGTLSVDENGRVWRHRELGTTWDPPIVAEYMTKYYFQVSATVDGGRYTIAAHRLVCIARGHRFAAGEVVNHINNLGFDNRPDNLEVVSHSRNIRHGSQFSGNPRPTAPDPFEFTVSDAPIDPYREAKGKGQFRRCSNCRKKRSRCKGLCDKCYFRLRRHGDPNKVHFPWGIRKKAERAK